LAEIPVSEEYLTFVNLFRDETGLDLGNYNQAQMYRRLDLIKQKHGFSNFGELFVRIKEDPELLKECLDKLTINVTEFFRDKEYWEILKQKTIMRAKTRLSLRIWSAGCATGEEAYSLAFMLNHVLHPDNCVLMASDIDSGALAKAKAGLYHEKALKGLDSRVVSVMFRKLGDVYQVKDRMREKISFFKHDLLSDVYPSELDIILCRNVSIYFKEGAKKLVYKKLTDKLNPGGILFIGASEQIIYPQDYGLVNEDVYFYRKT
jgi:chemotaxis protein methyltransferase CheR